MKFCVPQIVLVEAIKASLFDIEVILFYTTLMITHNRSLNQVREDVPPLLEARLSADARNASEHYLLNEATRYGVKRAEHIYHMLSLVAPNVECSVHLEELQKIDSAYEEILLKSRKCLQDNPNLYQELHAEVYRSQGQKLLQYVLKQSYEHGTEIDSYGNNDSELYQAEKYLDEIRQVVECFSPLIINHLPLSEPLSKSDESPRDRLSDMLSQSFREGIQERLLLNLEAEHRAHVAYRILGGLFEYKAFSKLTSFRELSELFREVSYQDISLSVDCLKKYYNFDFHRVCNERFGKKYGKALEMLLSGDVIQHKALALAQVLTERFVSSRVRGTEVRNLLEDCLGSDLQKIELACKEVLLHDKKIDYETLVEKKLSLHDRTILDAIRSDHDILRVNSELNIILAEKNAKRKDLRILFRQLNDQELDDLCDHLGGRKELLTLIEEKMPNSVAKDYCLARINKDEEQSIAAHVACTLHYKEDWIAGAFLNTTPETRATNIALYNHYYGLGREDAFYNDLESACDRDDFGLLRHIPFALKFCKHMSFPYTHTYPFMCSIVDSGDLSVGETFRFFMEGIGTDSVGLRSLLSTLTPTEFQEACQDYAERYSGNSFVSSFSKIPLFGMIVLNGDLRRDILAEVSGDLHHDIKRHFNSNPNDIESLYESLKERASQERGGAFFRHFKLDNLFAHNSIRALIDNRLEELDEVHNKLKAAPKDEALLARFHYLARSLEAVCDSYRLTRISLGEKLTDISSATAAAIGTFPAMFIFKLSPLQVIPISIMSCLLGRWFIQSSIVGLHGFGPQQRIIQSLKAIGEGSAMMTGRISLQVGKLISKGVSKFFFKVGVKTFFQKTIQNCQDKLLKQKKAQFFFPVQERFSLCDKGNKGVYVAEEMYHNGIVDEFETHHFNIGLENTFRQSLLALYVRPDRAM